MPYKSRFAGFTVPVNRQQRSSNHVSLSKLSERGWLITAEPEQPSTTGTSPTPSTMTKISPPTRIVSPLTRSRSSSPRRRKCGSTPLSRSIRKSWYRSGNDVSSRTERGKHRVSYAEFLVDGMGYLTALAKTDLLGNLNYSERNIVEKLFQTYTMCVGRFHETWNGSQPSAEWSAQQLDPSRTSVRTSAKPLDGAGMKR